MHVSEKIIPHRINQNYYFCQGHIGISNFESYLAKIPKIDLNYSSLPKPENFPLWYKLANKNQISHSIFFQGLTEIWKRIDAEEYHIEVGDSNKNQVLEFFEQWDDFPYFHQQDIWYSAPLNGKTPGLAKCRNPTKIIVFSKYKIKIPKVKYSHEYLEQLLGRPDKINCFDAVIGKGLLARYALQNGHACYGIDMNSKRLACVYEYIENNLKLNKK